MGPGASIAPLDNTLVIVDESINESATVSGQVTVPGFEIDVPNIFRSLIPSPFSDPIGVPDTVYGATLSGSVTGEVGLDVKTSGFDTGTLNVNYPVKITLSTPAPDSFRRGDTITIGSSFAVQSGASMESSAPSLGSIDVVGRFGLSTSLGLQVCFVYCDPTTSINITIPTISGTIFKINTQNRIVFDEFLGLLRIEDRQGNVIDTTPIEANLRPFFQQHLDIVDPEMLDLMNAMFHSGFNGYFGLPKVETTGSLAADGRSLVAAGQDEFVDFTFAMASGMGIVGNFGLDATNLLLDEIDGFTGDLDAEYLEFYDEHNLSMVQTMDFNFNPRPRVKLEFPQPVSFVINGCNPSDLFNLLDPNLTILDYIDHSVNVLFNPDPLQGDELVDFLYDQLINDPVFDLVDLLTLLGISQPFTQNMVACAGTSNTIVFDAGSSVDITVPSSGANNFNINPTFLLPNIFTAKMETVQTTTNTIVAFDAYVSTPGLIIFPGVSFERKCIGVGHLKVCTPEFSIPSLTISSLTTDIGPLVDETTVDTVSFPTSMLTPIFPWQLENFNTETGAPINLNPEYQPQGVLNGPTVLNEGQVGSFNTFGATDRDFEDGESLTFDWDFDDGILDAGDNVTHAYDDNGTYNVSVVSDDGHQFTDIDSQNVLVSNLPPLLSAGSNKTVDEGSPTTLGVGLFGSNLIRDPNAENGVSSWNTSDPFSTVPYGALRGEVQLVIPGGTIIEVGPSRTYATITAGIAAAQDFDTLIIDDGVYNETFTVNKRLLIQARNLGEAIIDGGGGAVVIADVETGGNGTIFKGLFFRNARIAIQVRITGDIVVGAHQVIASGIIDVAFIVDQNSGFAGRIDVFNSIIFNSGRGVQINDGGRIDVVNTIFKDVGIAYVCHNSDGGIVPSHNLLDNVTTRKSETTLCNGTGIYGRVGDGVNQIEDDAKFVDALGGNFRLRTGSPTLESGIDLGLPIAGVASDRGPFEVEGNLPGFGPPGPRNRGAGFFFGGDFGTNDFERTTGSQTINTGEGVNEIDAGLATYDLGGFLGGMEGQNDNATLVIEFRNSINAIISSDSIGPVFDADRLGKTGLIERLKSGSVPPLTRSIVVRLVLDKLDGQRNDAYADNLSLVLRAPVGSNFDDPGRGDTHTSNITWGDGGSDAGNVNETLGEGTVLGTHIYADDGVYPVFVTVTDDDHGTLGNGQTTDGFNVTVLNVAPVVSPVVPVIFVVPIAETNKLMATYSDVGVLDTHTATIDWGDGNISGPFTVTGGQVSGDHQYTVGGDFPRDITAFVTVTDDDGGTNTIPVTITLVDVQIPSIGAGADRSIIESGSVTPSGSFAAVVGQSLTYDYQWNFGDGTIYGPVAATPGVPQTAPAHTYADNGQFSVSFTVRAFASGGALATLGTDAFVVTVNNVAPVVGAAPNQTTLEGSVISLGAANFSDVGVQDTHTASINWGDGVVEAAFLNQPGKLLGGSHAYAENGNYTVTVTVIDDDGGVGEGSFEVSVGNVAPTVQPGPNKTIDEGQSVNIATTGFNDAGTLDTHTALINWGDGTAVVAGVVDQSNKIVSGSHSYADDRATPYTVTIRVFDDEGAEGSGTISVTVNNVTPVINAGSDKIANENTIVVLNQAFFTDAGVGDVHTAAVNWGDGTVEAASVSESNGSGSITASHVYADDRATPYTGIVCVDDGNAVNGSACDDFAITINNVAPTVDADSDQTPDEGQTVTLQGDINDAAADEHTATIDWGDGTEELGSVNQSTDTVSGSHAYADNGIFTVTVTVADDEGASNSDSIKVTVGNVVPDVTSSGQQTLDEGDFINLSGTYSDPGFDNFPGGTTEDFTATIDWGDGTSEPASTIALTEIPGGSGTLTTGTVQASHADADDDVYTVTLTVCDDNNGCGSSTLQVTVNNELPTLEAGPDQDEVTEGLSVSLGSAAFSDPGFDNFPGGTTEDFTATINWGDGSNVDQATVFETSGNEGTLTNGSIIGNHVYSDNGDYTVTVCVSDDDGAPVCDTFEVTVLNTAPTIEAGADQPTDEGTEISLDPSTFNDLGTADTHTATIDWGDGTSVDTGVVTESPFGPTGSIDGADGTIDGSHIYADNGTYTVTVCVADDELDEVCDTFDVTVDNVEPTVNAAISRGNQITTEGIFITLDPVIFSDPGFDRSETPTQENFSATIDWGDGNFEPVNEITLVETPGTDGTPTTGTVQATHAYGDNGIYTVTICLTDDDNATTCDTLQVTVGNVPPSVEAGPDRVINESITVFVGPPPVSLSTTTPATYSDPGFDNLAADVPALATQENFTSTIDWGEGTVDVGVLVEAPGAEGALTTGTVSGSHVYGDDGIYTVTVCVTDDDDATTCDTFTVTVNNVAPMFDDSVFLDAAVTFASLDDAFLGRKGVQQTYEALATDIGSDDLRYDWTFTYNPDNFGGLLPPSPETESTTTFNDGSATGTLPFSDPAREEGAGLHPHGTFPFTSGDSANVTFVGPGVYTVDVQVTDDNGGTDFATLPKIITDNCDCAKGLGFWKKEFKIRSEKDDKKVEKGTLIDEPTLAAYLDIIRFASSHFDENVPLMTFVDASKVLNPEKHRGTGRGSGRGNGGSNEATNPSGTGSRKKNNGGSGSGTGKNVAKKREDALKHTLSAWLNFAKGAVDWDEPIIVEGGTGTGTKAKPEVVMPFNEVIAEVESILNNPDATHRELVHAKNLAESINKLDKGNPDCTGTGSKSGTGSGTASKSTKRGDDTKGSDSGSKQKGKKGNKGK